MRDIYNVRLRKVGEALSITVPKPMREAMGWTEGEFIELRIDRVRTRTHKGTLTAAPVQLQRVVEGRTTKRRRT
jgi:bifunctional DNA-binding transcriptional regulator/antitoxin component of YhaV-PrlF toxin-antitoxin module